MDYFPPWIKSEYLVTIFEIHVLPSFIWFITWHPHGELVPRGHQLSTQNLCFLPELTTIAPFAHWFSVVRPWREHQNLVFAFLENIDNFKKKWTFFISAFFQSFKTRRQNIEILHFFAFSWLCIRAARFDVFTGSLLNFLRHYTKFWIELYISYRKCFEKDKKCIYLLINHVNIE